MRKIYRWTRWIKHGAMDRTLTGVERAPLQSVSVILCCRTIPSVEDGELSIKVKCPWSGEHRWQNEVARGMHLIKKDKVGVCVGRARTFLGTCIQEHYNQPSHRKSVNLPRQLEGIVATVEPRKRSAHH